MSRLVTPAEIQIRLATMFDCRNIERLIELSALRLQQQDHSVKQIKAALGTVFGVDTQLIKDRTYFVIENDTDMMACGGWSKRKTLFGSDANKKSTGKSDDAELDTLLDAQTDAARIRAFFVHPDYARQGLGKTLIELCEAASIEAGFRKMTLVATMSGERLYQQSGYTQVKRFDIELVNNELMPAVSMEKDLLTEQD